jgi:protein gp37
MSALSAIEWTESTWNPTTGCNKISPGCTHCYAERFAERFRGVPGHPYEQGFDIRLWPDRLTMPLTWKKPRLVFVNSMSDLFHPEIPDEFIKAVFSMMQQAHWHQFQVLTKRPERMLEIAKQIDKLPANVWAGVSVESQAWAWRVDVLREIPAQIRFLSCEPLLGDLKLLLDDIHWVIVGGESGNGARPMQAEMGQKHSRAVHQRQSSLFLQAVGRSAEEAENGRTLDDRTWDDFPQFGAARCSIKQIALPL